MQHFAWVDISKGILIMLVVLHHLPMEANYCDMHYVFMQTMESIDWIYTPFFMAAFFVTAGYCSNFDVVGGGVFMKKQFNSLIIPNITIVFISAILDFRFERLINFGFWFYHSMWFFKALFFSKLIYYLIHQKTKSDLTRLIFCIILFVIGSSLYIIDRVPNVFYFKSGLLFTFFVFCGELIRRRDWTNNKFFFLSLTIYMSLMLSFALLGIEPPYLGAINNFSWTNIAFFIPLALSGSLMVIGISKIIGHNYILQRIGISSLVIYGFSSRMMSYFMSFSKNIMSLDTLHNNYCCFFYVLSVFLFALSSCLLIHFFMTRKTTCWMLGKNNKYLDKKFLYD